MLDAIEKQRKVLSANLEATVHLESLLEDEDMHRSIKRTEFEELIQPLIGRFQQVLLEAFELSGKY
jgi:heat shock protein 4